jgi:hypothetical protein
VTSSTVFPQADTFNRPLKDVAEIVPPIPKLEISFQPPNVLLHWETRTNRLYQLQYRANLFLAEWADLGGLQSGNGVTAFAPDSAVETQRFYLVITLTW